jgi:hypothetical protein
LPKQIVSKGFYKKIDQKPKTDFFPIVLITFLGRFSVRGVQKHDKEYRRKSDPGPFLASDPPTHHGGHRFFLGRPPGGGGGLIVNSGWQTDRPSKQ